MTSPLPRLRTLGALCAALMLTGCPYLGEKGYDDKVRDVDGDGFIAERFGGTDCDDADPKIGNCDADADGFRSVAAGGEDCNDEDATIHPDANEVCDDTDNDCDGLVDNDDELIAGPTVWRDADGDGWGSDEGRLWCGDAPSGYAAATRNGDCNDNDGSTYPGAPEDCDSIDRNCDGDPTVGAADGTDWYADVDGDGHGSGPVLAKACEQPSSDLAADDDDCAPTDPDIHPSADEVPYDGIDQDCLDGDLIDVDGDGEAALAMGGTDCNDDDIAINTNAVEICNDLDDDCDSVVDDGLLVTSWPDVDGDSFGDPLVVPTITCDALPAGHVDNADDCNDDDGAINPLAAEFCDDVDNDCDGVIDGANASDAVTRYADEDGDLYGDPSRPIVACLDDLPLDVLWSDNDLDCDDTTSTANPLGTETCDGYDNDCNGIVDDAEDRGIYFVDADGDGYGDDSQPVQSCTRTEDLSLLSGDCNDSDPDSYPGAPEICGDALRQDCSDADPFDCDGDGVLAPADCDDENDDIGPFALEVCDGIDNDCDGDIDDDDPSVELATRADWFEDEDGDGIGSQTVLAANTCTPPPGSVRFTGDCDDLDPNRTPGAIEACDDVDNDCDGLIDEDVSDGTEWFADADGDGFGEAGSAPIAIQCEPPSAPSAANADDCDDALAIVSPDADEACDGIDNNCDGNIDDDDPDVIFSVWFLDEDGDGYGNDSESVESCLPPAGYVADAGDCDDASPDRAPGSDELCDGLDNDCDGLVDGDDPDETQPSVWFADVDGDGYGDPSDFIEDCFRPNGYVADDTDCDDDDPLVRPGALETCDGADNDCDEIIDEAAADATIWFFDEDGDGWGAVDRSTLACEAPENHVALSGDCNDEEPTVRPGAAEVCGDGLDNDCNGLTDGEDAGAIDVSWYPDLDGDGAGDATATGIPGCDAPPDDPFALSIPWAPNDDDCDDSDPEVGPHAVEICDGDDNDCDGLTDSEDDSVDAPRAYVDADDDGYGVGSGAPRCETGLGWAYDAGDCDDADPLTHPGAVEECDSIDNDCNGSVDEGTGFQWVLDADDDDFFDLSSITMACTQPGPDWSQFTGSEVPDCDDGNSAVNDDAPEVCDGVDNDCSGTVDDGAGLTWTIDADGDGYGEVDGTTVVSCTPPAGFVSNALDCVDTDDKVHPGVLFEFCNNIDDDCNGQTDDNAIDALRYYVDGDGDGVAANDATAITTCSPDAEHTLLLGDCDDSDAAISPLAVELCDAGNVDEDCNGVANDDDPNVDGTPYYADVDGDGHGRPDLSVLACSLPAGFAASSDDCDDTRDVVSPTASEVCDGLDNDCNGTPEIDEVDVDGDGYVACEPYVENGAGLQGGDCGEGNPDQFPGAPEQCNQLDDDCNEEVDDLVSNRTYWFDDDNDGFGDPAIPSEPVCVRPPGYADNADDCDDSNGSINPGEDEIPGDDIDQNCDDVEDCYIDDDGDGYRLGDFLVGGTNGDADCDDNGEALVTAGFDCDDTDGGLFETAFWYADCDGDGEPGTAYVTACGADAAAAQFTDCNDGLPPNGGMYVAAGNDCNDENPTVTGDLAYYPDCDNDGHASSDPAREVLACGLAEADVNSSCPGSLPPAGGWSLASGNDCDDDDDGIAPGIPETVGDGIDVNCDNLEVCYVDQDGDTYRSQASSAPTADIACAGTNVALEGAPEDCDDADPTGQFTQPWYVDCDVDNYASAAGLPACGEDGARVAFSSCPNPAATFTNQFPDPDDCADTDPSVNPGAYEVPGDNFDSDCDRRELCYVDIDDDGARTGATQLTLALNDTDCLGFQEGEATDPLDCLDTDASISPLLPETVGDEVDQNCDNRELCWADADFDGFRSDADTALASPDTVTCDESGRAPDTAPIDCDDTDGMAGPADATWYADCDDDGWFGTHGVTQACTAADAASALSPSCERPLALADVSTVPPDPVDCRDLSPGVNPGASEVPGNNLDDDCDGSLDCFEDLDGDFAGSAVIITSADQDCDDLGEARDTDPFDCDDGDILTFTGATEIVGDNKDQSCDGAEDCYRDDDDDGAPVVAVLIGGVNGDEDCLDAGEGTQAQLDADLDCNDSDGTGSDPLTWYGDCDFDSYYGEFSDTPAPACGAIEAASALSVVCGGSIFPDGVTDSVPMEWDCDDSEPTVRPDGTEVAGNNLDEDCSGTVDCFEDLDGDFAGSAVVITTNPEDLDCLDLGEALSIDPFDCNDGDPLVFTGAPELVGDEVDQNCNGLEDCWTNQDNDSAAIPVALGEGANTNTDCSEDGEGTQAQLDAGPDCNDLEPTGQASVDWWADCDDDTLFGEYSTTVACGQPDALVNLSSTCGGPIATSQITDQSQATWDCNDFDPTGLVFAQWYPDCDNDGVAATAFVNACGANDAAAQFSLYTCPLPPTQVVDSLPISGDCDDFNLHVYPGAPEVCDGQLNDCLGSTFPMPPAVELDDDGDMYIECFPFVDQGVPSLLGGRDCNDDPYDPISYILHPGQVLDLDTYPAGGFLPDIQSAINAGCDDTYVLPASYSIEPNGIVLPIDKVVVVDGTGRNAFIDEYSGTHAVIADETPLGTEVIGFTLYALDEYAVLAQNNAELVLRDISFYGSGEGPDKGLLARQNSHVVVQFSTFDSLVGPSGSAIFADTSASVEVFDSTFFYNRASAGSPVEVVDATLFMHNAFFQQNTVETAGQYATAIWAKNSTTTLDGVEAILGVSGDRQPTILIEDGNAQLDHVRLRDNPGGLWLIGSSVSTIFDFDARRTGGQDLLGFYEGAIEMRDVAGASIENAVIAGADGPGIHLRGGSSVDIAYSTIVGNHAAGVLLDAGNLNLDITNTVVHGHPDDVIIDATYNSIVNQDLVLEHSLSPGLLCSSPATQNCVATDPLFITYHPNLPPWEWILRPYAGGPLWNGEPLTGWNAFRLIGHAGGPGSDVDWYNDIDGDSMADGWEIHWTGGTTQLDYGVSYDLDSWHDDFEFSSGTNPTWEDTDGDGMYDDFDPEPLNCDQPFQACPQN